MIEDVRQGADLALPGWAHVIPEGLNHEGEG